MGSRQRLFTSRPSTSRLFTARLSTLALLVVGAAGLVTRPARADGGNDVCPATYQDADDIRERYDAEGRLVHQLRLRRGRYVQEIAVAYDDEHAVARTEVTVGHRRIARTRWDGDRVASAECFLDGALVARAAYRYDGERLASVEKLLFVAPPAPVAAPALVRPPAPAPAATPAPAPAAAPATGAWRRESTRFFYDADGRLSATEVRMDGKVVSVTRADRAPKTVPVRLSLTAGGSYQSDTELYDLTAGIGIRRRPEVLRYGADPLDVALEATFKFHRAAGVTSTDQTTVRFSADYHQILPRITLFTFTSTDRNLPANLRLNLEEAVLGVKLEIVPRDRYQLDVSFAPVWNYRAIISPSEGGGSVDESTSQLRGSFRARAGVHRETWSLLDTFEFLPTLYGDDMTRDDGFSERTVLRNTLTLEVTLSEHLTLREELKYTRDPAMRAQARCPDESSSLCRGYAIASTTALVLDLAL